MRRDLILFALLTGCSATPAKTVIIPQAQPNAAFAIPTPQPLTINHVQWQVMTSEQLKTLADRLQKAQDHKVVLVLDQENYNNLALNLVEIERYIKEQKAILDMVKSVIAQRSQPNEAKE
jgi:hypothetical protein